MAQFNSKNCKFYYGTAGGTPDNEVTQVISGTLDTGDVITIDNTTITDTTATLTAGHRETISGSITVAFDYAVASHLAIVTAHLAGTIVSIGFKEFDDSATPVALKLTFSDCVWTTAPIPQAVNGLLQATFSFKGVSAPTITTTF